MDDRSGTLGVAVGDGSGRRLTAGQLYFGHLMSSTASINDLADQATTVNASGLNRTRVWSFVSTVGFTMAIVLLQLGQGVLLARLLGPEGRGQYAAAVLYTQMLLYIGLMGGLEVICRRAAVLSQRSSVLGVGKLDAGHRASGRVDRLRRTSLRLGLTTGLITTAFVIVLAITAMPSDKREIIPLAILCGLSVVGQHVVLMMTAVDRGTERFTAYNIQRFIAAAAFPMLIGTYAVWMDLTVAMACWLFVLASLISMAACLYGLQKPLSGDSSPTVSRLLHRSRPYGLSMLATDFFERMDLLLVLWLAPLVQQGFYAAMVPAVYPLTVIPHTLGVFLFNAGADKNRRLSVGGVHRVLASSIVIQSVVTIVFVLLIGRVVELVYGADFAPAVRYALWLAPASAIRGILQGIDGYLKGRGRPMACVTARVLGMLTLIGATMLLLPAYGVIAIAMAVLISQSVCLVALSAVMYADCGRTQE